jgi:catechol 2,3-dioxygenase-like lactoylglutathione lyase family enzyme
MVLGCAIGYHRRLLVQCYGETSVRVEALNHVQLAMPAGEEAAARRFYEGILGIPEVEKPPHLAKRGGCWFERGSLKVHLGIERDFRPAKKAHPAFTVTNLAFLIQRLREEGFEIVEDEPLAGYDRCYVADPFGNRIELMEPSQKVL